MPCPKNGPCQCASYVEPLDLCCLVSGSTFPDFCLSDGGQPVKQELIDSAILAATEILWAATGRQFGVCTVKIRPCRTNKGCDPCPDGGGIEGLWLWTRQLSVM